MGIQSVTNKVSSYSGRLYMKTWVSGHVNACEAWISIDFHFVDFS